MLEGLLARSTSEDKRAELRAELAELDMPEGGAPLWWLYLRLRRRKASNGFSVNPIEWHDIAAFSAVTGVRLLDWEVGAIEDIDDAFMAQQAASAKAEADKQKRQDKQKGH